jgi:bla regulator protein blaR1
VSAAGFASWAAEALVASALLIAAVMAVRTPVRRAFGPHVAYALWALPVLRLALPPLPAALREAAAAPIARAGEQIVLVIEPAAGAAAAAAPSAAPLPWGAILVGAWAAGAGLFLLYHWLAHARFVARVLADREEMEAVGGVRVVASDAAPGPLAFGIWRRYVAFPRDFAERFDAGERELALAHELGHHARGDLLANWVALAVLALHWFNPLAWAAFRAFRADQEMANDARVLGVRGRASAHAYACAIVKAAHGRALSPACHLHTVADLKGRLRMLNARISRRRLATGAAAVAVLTLAGLGATASGTRAAVTRVGHAAGVDLSALRPVAALQAASTAPVAPQAPALPEAPAAPPAAKGKRVVIVRNGETTTYEGADADRWLAQNPLPVPPAPPVAPVPGVAPVPPAPPVPPVAGQQAWVIRQGDGAAGSGKPFRLYMRRGEGFPTPPEVTSRDCRGGDDKAFVLHEGEGQRKRIVICSNRIEHAAEAGARLAANADDIRARAMLSARSGLERARAAIAANRSLTDAARSDALRGLDEALADLARDARDDD